MKKVLSIVAIAAMTVFAASCGDAAAELQRIADSLRQDSIRQVAVADSIAKAEAEKRTADSLANAAAAQRMIDSLRQDSIDKASKGKGTKPKTTEQKVKEEAKKVTSGRG